MDKKPTQKKKTTPKAQDRLNALREHTYGGITSDDNKNIAFKNSTIDYLNYNRKRYFPDVDSTSVMQNSDFNTTFKNQKKLDSLGVAMDKEKSMFGKAKQFMKMLPKMTGDATADAVWNSVYKSKKNK